jgi:hypothetical protein
MPLPIAELSEFLWKRLYHHLSPASRVCPPTGCQVLLFASSLKSYIGAHKDNRIRTDGGKQTRTSTDKSLNLLRKNETSKLATVTTLCRYELTPTMADHQNTTADCLTNSLIRQNLEDALKKRFHVNWLLYNYNGKHLNDYPGSITKRHDPTYGTWDHLTYGNCRRCHLMGPMGDQCYACGPHLHFLSTCVLILAKQQLCDPRERWYNPEFLDNTNNAKRIVKEPVSLNHPQPE